MIHLAETMYCCSLACSYEGVKEEAGSYYVNTLLANEVKLNCTRNMYEISRLAHDIAGGFIATLPHEWDLNNPETGKWIEKFFVGTKSIRQRQNQDRKTSGKHVRRYCSGRIHAWCRISTGNEGNDSERIQCGTERTVCNGSGTRKIIVLITTSRRTNQPA